MNLISLIKRKPLLALAAVMALAALVIYLVTRKESDSISVPLGVEQAAIVTYSGPTVAVAPYKWGVAVNVRIAQIIERDDKRIYDVRYIVNREGTFDLKNYLVATDGTGLEGLPTFKFTGDPKLSKHLDNRIQETEEIRVEVGGRYYETLTGLTLLWIGWLLLLIFYKRPRPVAEIADAPPGPSLAEMLRSFLSQLETGTLDADAKAKMEMVMLQCWRNELALGHVPMNTVLDEIGRHEKTGGAMRKIQHWLHHPASSVQNADIAAVVAPYTLETMPSEIASAS